MMRSIATSLLLVALVTIACSEATRHAIETETSAPEWQGDPMESLLVIGVYTDRPFRISTESILAAELTEHGIASTTSYDLLPDLEALGTVEQFRDALQSAETDGILTLATLEAGEQFDYDAWQAQYAFVRLLGSEGFFTRLSGAFDSYDEGRLVLDLGLWDATDLSTIWTATTESYTKENHSEQVRTFTDFIVGVLDDRGYI